MFTHEAVVVASDAVRGQGPTAGPTGRVAARTRGPARELSWGAEKMVRADQITTQSKKLTH